MGLCANQLILGTIHDSTEHGPASQLVELKISGLAVQTKTCPCKTHGAQSPPLPVEASTHDARTTTTTEKNKIIAHLNGFVVVVVAVDVDVVVTLYIHSFDISTQYLNPSILIQRTARPIPGGRRFAI